MDDLVQKPSLKPVDPFALPQRPTPPLPPRPGQPFPSPSDKPSAPDLRFVEPASRPSVPVPPPAAAPSVGRPVVPPPTPSSVPPSPARPISPNPTAAPAGSSQEYRSSIRTMSEDISRIKTGQQPMGVDVQKTMQAPRPAIPTPVPAASSPITPSVPGSGIQASLGQAERARPLAPNAPASITPPPTPSSISSPQIIIPESGGPSRNRLYVLIALGAILVGGLYWFLSSGDDDIAQITPTLTLTPRITATATPAPKTIAALIGGSAETINLANSGDPSADFWAKVNALSISGGEMRRLAVTAQTKENGELTPVELLDRFIVSYPAELKNLLTGESAIVAYGQREAFDAKGIIIPVSPVQKRIILISELRDSTAVQLAMKTWESTMTNALASLFKYNKAKAATQSFLDNIYQNKAVRYKNFAYPDNTIDYSIVQASNGKIYLVLTHSREALFSAIDKIR